MVPRPSACRSLTMLLCLLLAGLAGCAAWPPGFIPSSIFGELHYLSRMEPIESALDDPSLTQEQRDKLAYLLRARDYCQQVIGLNVDNNFQTFVNLGDEPLAWNLTASRKDAFEPYIWTIPIAGRLPYLGFFDFDRAIAERDRLVKAGYDTFVYEIDAFAIPFLPDPVTSRVLRRGYGDLGNVVAHELTHNTVSDVRDVTFSESLANFVGRTVAIEFLGVEFGQDSPTIQETLDGYDDDDRFQAYLAQLTTELRTLYASGISKDDKIAQRKVIFQTERDRFATEVLPLMHNSAAYETYTELLLNNAFLLVNTRYNSDQEIFSLVFEQTGRNWHEALAVFAAAGNSPNPIQYLQDYLAAHGSSPSP